jgi:uncharacterized membrane protein YdjX (TVP38/TMEM64 family)
MQTWLGPERRLQVLRIFAFLFVVGIVALVLINRERVQELAHYGYLGIFLITLIANATVFVPVPGVMMVFAMGSVLNPVMIAVLGGLGGATGEISGYMLGFSGQGFAQRSQRLMRIQDWMVLNKKRRDLAVFILAAIPNPFFDLAGIAAGTLKIPLIRFWIACALGSILKYLLFAYLGDTALGILRID